MRALPWPARIYVSAVWLVAACAIAPALWVPLDWATILILAGAYLLAESAASFTIRGLVNVSIGPAIGLAAVLLLPPSGAALVVFTGTFANPQHRRSWVQRLFNGAMLACSAAAAGVTYDLVGGHRVLRPGGSPDIAQYVAAAIVYCVVNGLLLAGVLRATEGTPVLRVWRSTLSGSVVDYLGYGLFGLIIAALWHADGGRFTAILILLPLYIARWVFALYAEQQQAYDATVRALVQAVETKDYYTRGHSERVASGAVMIAKEIGMSDERTESLRLAGMLHDLGKLGVPTRVLQKSGPLTEDEFAAIQLHPVRGVEVVRGIEFLREAYNGIMHHHERVDGRGYPLGLNGKDIPEFARVIAVADAFDCMTSTRSYRSARSVDEALNELHRCADAQFDPEIVDALEKGVHEHGWEPAVAPPPAEVASASTAQFDHDDPTIRLTVIRGSTTTRIEPDVRVVPRHARSAEETVNE
jgi:HD domain